MFTEFLKQKILYAVSRSDSDPNPEPEPSAISEVAMYPLCSRNNETSWLEENTAKLYFSSNIFDKLGPNTMIHSGVLRFVLPVLHSPIRE